MPETRTILQPTRRVVLPPESAADPLEVSQGDVSKPVVLVSPQPRYQVGPGLWVDYQPESGVETRLTYTSQALQIETQSVGNSPWFSLSYDVDLMAAREARFMAQIVVSSCATMARIRSCLRYHLAEGFTDSFARDLIVLTGGASHQQDCIFMPVDEDLIAQARAVEVLLFFEGRSFDVSLHAIQPFQI